MCGLRARIVTGLAPSASGLDAPIPRPDAAGRRLCRPVLASAATRLRAFGLAPSPRAPRAGKGLRPLRCPPLCGGMLRAAPTPGRRQSWLRVRLGEPPKALARALRFGDGGLCPPVSFRPLGRPGVRVRGLPTLTGSPRRLPGGRRAARWTRWPRFAAPNDNPAQTLFHILGNEAAVRVTATFSKKLSALKVFCAESRHQAKTPSHSFFSHCQACLSLKKRRAALILLFFVGQKPQEF